MMACDICGAKLIHASDMFLSLNGEYTPHLRIVDNILACSGACYSRALQEAVRLRKEEFERRERVKATYRIVHGVYRG